MQVPPFSLQEQLSNIGHDLDLAVLKTLHSGQYIGGDEVKSFEKAFSESISVPHSVACNSGTDALILALRALDIGPGDEVITVSFSFFATAEAISNVGAKPIFVDVEPNNFLIDINQIKAAITPSTKAILPVHLFGNPVDMDAIISISKEYGLKVIEDCAQAVGTTWAGKPVGGFGDIGCFSFFPTKNLGAAGDGGAITTHEISIAKRIRELAVHGMPKRYFHTELGYNSRLDAIQAAILNVKLHRLSEWINQREEIARRYIDSLKDLKDLIMPVGPLGSGSRSSWNQFVIKVVGSPKSKGKSIDQSIDLPEEIANRLHDSSNRDWLKLNLSKKGINTIIYYPIPIHLQPVYSDYNFNAGSLLNSELLASQVLSLPIFPELSIEQQDYVITIIRDFYSTN